MRKIVIGQPVVAWVATHGQDFGNFASSVGFGVEDENGLIAGVVFSDYNGANINMHVASDRTKRWMTRELLWMVFDYAFNQAHVRRITGLVGEGNTEAQNFDKHIGFKLETTLEAAHPTGDLLVFKMTREDCRWLNSRRPQRELLEAA